MSAEEFFEHLGDQNKEKIANLLNQWMKTKLKEGCSDGMELVENKDNLEIKWDANKVKIWMFV